MKINQKGIIFGLLLLLAAPALALTPRQIQQAVNADFGALWPHIVTAQETFFEGEGNLTNYGQCLESTNRPVTSAADATARTAIPDNATRRPTNGISLTCDELLGGRLAAAITFGFRMDVRNGPAGKEFLACASFESEGTTYERCRAHVRAGTGRGSWSDVPWRVKATE